MSMLELGQVAAPSPGRNVGKEGDPVSHQGATLHIHQTRFWTLQENVQPARAVSGLRPDVSVTGELWKGAEPESLGHDEVGDARVYRRRLIIDLNADHVEPGLTMASTVPGPSDQKLCSGEEEEEEELFQPSRVGEVTLERLSLVFCQHAEPARPGEEAGPAQIALDLHPDGHFK